jgi:hypothetical protein
MIREQWIRNRAYALWCFRNVMNIENNPIKNWLDAEFEYDTFYAPHLKFFQEEKII